MRVGIIYRRCQLMLTLTPERLPDWFVIIFLKRVMAGHLGSCVLNESDEAFLIPLVKVIRSKTIPPRRRIQKPAARRVAEPVPK